MNSTFLEKARSVHGDTYDYSSVVYTAAREKVDIICREHGVFSQTPDKHINGKQGCPRCKPSAVVDEAEFIRRLGKVHGDRLIAKPGSYSKMFEKVTVVCPAHGEFRALPTNLISKKTGCPKCAAEARGLKQRLTLDVFIQKAVARHGNAYDYSRSVVVDGNTPVAIGCRVHGEFAQSPVKHMHGHGCPVCGVEKRTSVNFKGLEQFVLDAVAVHGDAYDYSKFEYVSARSCGTIICKKHGEFTQTPDGHLAGKGCSKCVSQVSKWETEIADFLLSIGVNAVRTRKIAGVEFDLYADGVAIECNGLYWHSDMFENAKNRHLHKTRAAQQAGVRLIHIFEDEWTHRRSAVENLLRSAYNKSGRTYARQCTVDVETSKGVEGFLDTHHIQGAATGSVAYVLRKDGVTVAAMVFSKVRSERGAVDAGWELVRYASNGTVVGGASRLFARFVKDQSPKRVVSYSDDRLFFGGVYVSLGFNRVHLTPPQYRVVVRGRRVHKSNFKKSKLVKAYGIDTVGTQTEREFCQSIGLHRVYDCGLTKWEYVGLCV